jgi:hypothetical protein
LGLVIVLLNEGLLGLKSMPNSSLVFVKFTGFYLSELFLLIVTCPDWFDELTTPLPIALTCVL